MAKLPAQDIVERLLQGDFAYISDSGPVYEGPTLLGRDAADTISRLTADNEALRSALEAERAAMDVTQRRAISAEARADALAQEAERQTDRFASWHEQMAVDAASAPDGDAQSRFHQCCAGLIRNDPHVRATLRSLQGGEDGR